MVTAIFAVVEALEQGFLSFLGDAFACVNNTDDDVVIVLICLHIESDTTAFGCVFGCV